MRGSIRKKKSKGGRPSWEVRWEEPRDPATGMRSQRSKTFPTRADGEAHLRRVAHDLDEGQYVRPSKQLTGEFLLERWLPAVKSEVRPSTYDSYRSNVEAHIAPYFKTVPIGAIRPDRIKQFHTDLLASGRRKNGTGGLSPRTVGYIHMILRRALRDAAKWGLIRSNPAAGLTKPKVEESDKANMRPWSKEQAQAFLAHVLEHRLYALYLLALTTGMRRGEILGLRWGDVPKDGPLITRRTVVLVGNEAKPSAPKTKRSRRRISLDRRTAEALRKHKTRQGEERIRLGLGAPGDEDLVFTREDGSPINPRALSASFARLNREAGLPPIRFHDLRHTYATVALREGVNPKIVSERLGHHAVAFTFDVYAHFLPADDATAAEDFAASLLGGRT